MLRKTPVKGSDKISVTFFTDQYGDAGKVAVVGEFNAWDPEAMPMKKRRDGRWSATVRLPAGDPVQYRFVVDGSQWEPDTGADDQVPNPFGGINSVCVLDH